MNFTAHGVSSLTWWESQTEPMPPSPSFRTSRNLSATTVPSLRCTTSPRRRSLFLRLGHAGRVRLLAALRRLVDAVRPRHLLSVRERLQVGAALVEVEG